MTKVAEIERKKERKRKRERECYESEREKV